MESFKSSQSPIKVFYCVIRDKFILKEDGKSPVTPRMLRGVGCGEFAFQIGMHEKIAVSAMNKEFRRMCFV